MRDVYGLRELRRLACVFPKLTMRITGLHNFLDRRLTTAIYTTSLPYCKHGSDKQLTEWKDKINR